VQEITAIKALLAHDVYLQYGGILTSLKSLPSEHKQVLASITSYYDKFPDSKDTGIGIDELQLYFNSQNPSLKNGDMFKKLFDDLRVIDVGNAELRADTMDLFVEQYYCNEIMESAMTVADGQKSHAIADIEDLVSKFKETITGMEDVESEVCQTSFLELLENETQGGFTWPVEALNANLGPVRAGQLGHIFARPNIGKSSLAINMAVWTAYQQHISGEDGVVLFLNNEEDIGRIKLRALSCSTNRVYETLNKDLATAEELWIRKGGDQIKFIGNINHISTVEKHIQAFKPVMTIIDQGPKVSIYDRDIGEVQRLQRLYNQYRSLAKEYQTALITTGQADNEAENRQYLSLNNLDGSKVGVPGELDWAVGIGRREDDAHPLRYFNVAKNKGRMGRGQLNFDELRCRYEDLK